MKDSSTDSRVSRRVWMRAAWLLTVGSTAPVAAAEAQIRPVIVGRVEDAITREALLGVRLWAASDSTFWVFSDSLGAFALPVEPGGSISVQAERFGYLSQSFDLGSEAASRISVLLLEPAPLELAGIEVLADAALTELLDDLRARRNAFGAGPVMAFHRAQLDRYFPTGTALDVFNQRVRGSFRCTSFPIRSGLCLPGRVRTLQNPFPQVPVRVCIDGWEPWDADEHLRSLDISEVGLVEVFDFRGRGGVRVYTTGYLTSVARTGRHIATPLWMGC